jgi:hypothetical protein
LLEHLRDRITDHLLILAAIVAEGVLSDATPHKTLRLLVVEIDNQGSNHILLRCDAAHPTSESPHTHGGVSGLLLHPAVRRDD